MSAEPEDQDEVEWDQAAYWQVSPETAAAPEVSAESVDETDPPPPRAAPGRGARAARRALSVARLLPAAGTVRHALSITRLQAARAWNALMDRVRRTRPARPRGVTPTGAGLVAVVAIAVVAGSVALVSYYGPDAVTASGSGDSSPAHVGPPSDEIPLPSDSPDGDTPSPSASASPSTSTSPRSASQRPDQRESTRAKPEGGTTDRKVAVGPRRTVRGYRLVSSLSGKTIGVSSGSTADGAHIVQVSTKGKSQQWRLVSVDSGHFNVINRATGKALDNPDGSQSDGTQIQQWTITGHGNANQQWRFTPAGDGYYLIVNRASGRALDLRDGNVSDGAAIQQWEPASSNPNQRWRVTAVY
ncbi:MAG: RICIN domain-containing protein [Micromonosporaceae bacterium]